MNKRRLLVSVGSIILADAGPGDVSVHLEAFVNMSGTRSTEGRP